MQFIRFGKFYISMFYHFLILIFTKFDKNEVLEMSKKAWYIELSKNIKKKSKELIHRFTNMIFAKDVSHNLLVCFGIFW